MPRKNELLQTRIKCSEEPVLHVHRYVVAVGHWAKDGNWYTKYHYCMNKKEVKALRDAIAKDAKTVAGTIIEVFKAQHNYVEGFFTKKRAKG